MAKLEQLFHQSRPHEKIVALTPLIGDGSSRQYFRLTTEKGKRYIASLQDDGKEQDFLAKEKLLRQHRVSLPTIHHSICQEGFMLLEDLGEETLWQKLASVEGEDEELALYQKALDELLKIRSIKNGPPIPALDENKLMEEVNFTLEHLAKDLLKREREEIVQHYREICQTITQKMVFCHRDFHSRNLMVRQDSIFVIDFQDAQVGPEEYDLVSLIDDCYYEILPGNKAKLKEYYAGKLNKDFKGMIQSYDYTLLQRVWKAMGSFAYFSRHKKDNRYLKYIGPSLQKLCQILNHYPQHAPLEKILNKISLPRTDSTY